MSEQPDIETQVVPPPPTTGELKVPDVDMTTPSGIMDKVIEGSIGRVLNQVDAHTVFGDPVTQGDRTVIPVARTTVNYGFGAGSGTSTDEKRGGTGGGGGGGGRVRSTSIGYIELTPSQARFVPIIDRNTLITGLANFAGVALVLSLPMLLRRKR